MKLHIISDLHLDQAGFVLPETDADVLVLVGNIARGAAGLEWLRGQRLVKPVVYVPGLLEFSAGGFEVFDGLVAAAGANVLLLHDDGVVVAGVRFIGTLLWTEGAMLAEAADCFAAQPAGRGLFHAGLLHGDLQIRTPADSRHLHRQCRARLRDMLAVPFSGKTVVVTHHGLTSASLRPPLARCLPTRAFVDQPGPVREAERVALWVHGNMQAAFDDVVGGMRVVCNPRGDGRDESANGFRPDQVIEI